MVDIKTKSGFEISISERILRDWRVVKALSRAYSSKKDASVIDAISDVLGVILGDNEERFYQHLMGEDGVVSSEDVMDEAQEILGALGEHQKN